MTANWTMQYPEILEEVLGGFLDEDNPEWETPPDLCPILELPETTSPYGSEYSYRTRFMAGKEEEYEATVSAYREIGTPAALNHSQSMHECRRHAFFAREKSSGDVKIMSSACRERWCPMCAGEKTAYAKGQTELYIKSLHSPRFLTLTLRHNDSNLKSQMEFLQDCFRRIRQRAYWKKNVTGGIWFLQVKRGKNSGCWHPHFHMLLDGNYLEAERLSALWELVTCGSPNIDIRRINDTAAAAGEVARYCARPAALAHMPMADRVEVIEALHGKRLSGTFGTAKAITLTPPKIESDDEWQQIGYYDRLMEDAETKPAAKTILDAYTNNEPISESLFETYTGHPVNYVVVVKDLSPPGKQILLDFYNTS